MRVVSLSGRRYLPYATLMSRPAPSLLPIRSLSTLRNPSYLDKTALLHFLIANGVPSPKCGVVKYVYVETYFCAIALDAPRSTILETPRLCIQQWRRIIDIHLSTSLITSCIE